MVQRKPAFRLDIIQDPPFSTFVFSPRPVVRARRRAGDRIQEGQVSEVLTWGTANRGTFDRGPRAYSIETCIPVENLFLTEEKNASFMAQSDLELSDEVNELRNSRSEFYSAFYTMNGSFLDRSQQQVLGQRRRWLYRAANDAKELYPEVWKLARELCMKDGGLLPPQKRVDTILQFLSPQNGYKYSRNPARDDRSLDPLVDFILNTKTGHCEYFASACALMLQCAEVPTRLVNGYYGSELNALTGKNEVRQRHAHAWVESYVDHQWITIEPTPSAQRQAEVALSANQSLISNLRSALSDFWSDGIQQMSAERQQEFFAPVISTSKSLVQTIREQGLWVTIRDSSAQFVKNPESWVSWQGGVITFLLLLLAGVLAKLNVFEKLWRFLMQLPRRSGHDSSTRSAIRFYEGFCTLCERNGIHFSPANSANENAARAVAEFASRLATDELRQVPLKIASAFNAVRYGHHTLSDDQVMIIGKDLETFSEALKSPHPV
jgi:transglutaminase-like putative cysteine protease